MHNPVRTSASWVAGRVLVFLVILVALVVWDAYRDESLMLAALTKGLLPDRELVERCAALMSDPTYSVHLSRVSAA